MQLAIQIMPNFYALSEKKNTLSVITWPEIERNRRYSFKLTGFSGRG
jgi:hypothetical protein